MLSLNLTATLPYEQLSNKKKIKNSSLIVNQEKARKEEVYTMDHRREHHQYTTIAIETPNP